MDIQLLLSDVDGVLTDGSILVDTTGQEIKRFHVRDGQGIVAWQKLGLKMGVLTGRPSPITVHRMTELGVEIIEQCSAMHKTEALEDICKRTGIEPANVAYIGDDLADLPVLVRVGYPMSVADGAAEVRDVARFVTTTPGGRGAIREAVEHLLKKMGRWDEVLEGYGI